MDKAGESPAKQVKKTHRGRRSSAAQKKRDQRNERYYPGSFAFAWLAEECCSRLLAETLRTPFDGDFLDATTTFERKIMIYEAQSRETISDSLKIGCVIAGMGQNSVREHFLMSATKCDSWTNFVREIESIEHARKTITAPTPMEIGAFHKCGKYGHTAKEFRSSSHGGAEKPQCAQRGKKHHGQCWTRSCTSSGNQGKGKGKGKKGQRLNEITEPPEEQWTGWIL